MLHAVVLANVQRNRVNEVAQEIADLEGVAEVFSVGGRYDLVAILRVEENEALADLVTHRMLKIEGITSTETMIAFRSYGKTDLEAMFDVGNPPPER